MVWLPLRPRKLDTKFREAETKAEADRKKKYYEAKAAAEVIKNSINPIPGRGALKAPPPSGFFVCHRQTPGDIELKISDF